MEYVAKPVNSNEPILHLLRCGMNPLIKSNPIQNAMTVDKVFYESTNGGTDRSIINRERKYNADSSAIPIRRNICPLHDG